MKLQDIISEFGSFYINSGQNMARLVRQLRTPSTTEQLFRSIITDDTEFRMSEPRIGRLLQPFQKSWTPLGEVEFKPVTIKQYPMKMDHEEYPDELEATWLGFLADNDLDRREWPFVRWLVEQELLPQLREDFEKNEIYDGVFSAPSSGSAGAAGTAMDGIKKIINDNINNGRISTIATGTIETVPADFVDQVEAFVDEVNEKYWGIQMELAMAPQLVKRYQRGYKEKYGTDLDFDRNNASQVDFSTINLKACHSMIGSSKIWMTPRENAIRLSKKSANMDTVRLEAQDRLVKIFTDFYKGIGFAIPEIVFTNDQDLGAAGSGSGSA